jgi:hypothetical protein
VFDSQLTRDRVELVARLCARDAGLETACHDDIALVTSAAQRIEERAA